MAPQTPTHGLFRLQQVVRTRFAIAAVAVACAGAAFGVALASRSASATDEKYGPCGSCAGTVGAFNWVSDNAAENISATGICAAIYVDNPEAKEYRACEGKPIVWERICLASEHPGFGEARRFYKEFEYDMKGREDNYTPYPKCPYIEA